LPALYNYKWYIPKDILVATFSIGETGASNAALFAISLLAFSDPEMATRLSYFWKAKADNINAITLPELE